MTIDQISTRWNLLVVAATALCAALGAFLVLPPIQATNNHWAAFGTFLVTALIGLWSVPALRWESRSVTRYWVIGAILFLILGTFTYFMYDNRLNAWTFEYAGQQEIAGEHFLPEAQSVHDNQVKTGRSGNDHDVSWEMGADFDAVWPHAEREKRLQSLLMLYLAQVLLFGSGVVTVVQSTYCASESSRETSVLKRGNQP